MKKGKSFDNLLTDLHSDLLPDSAVPALSLQSDGVVELTPLTQDEADWLATCERTINEGLSTFLAVGNALVEIRNNKLYRASHRTFEGYCRERFQLKRQRAYELMGAAEVVNSLSEISDKDQKPFLPERESHANALAELPISKRQEVWKQITDEAEQTQQPITSNRIKAVVKQRRSKHQPEIGGKSAYNTANEITTDNVPVSKARYIKQIKKAAMTVESHEIRIEVRGSWLVRHGLEDAWRELRGRPDWVINDKFKDTLTLDEAKLLGLLAKN